MSSPLNLEKITAILKGGGIIAYPTESCYGLGCDPDNEQAVMKIITLKKRAVDQGVIIIGANLDSLKPYCDTLKAPDIKKIAKTWPGPTTWLVPSSTHYWLRGKHPTLAMRVPDHVGAREICTHFGKPIVSTSANPHHFASAKTADAVYDYFNASVDLIVPGKIGKRQTPSTIIDLKTQKTIR